MRVAVFCSCTAQINGFFLNEIRELGRALAVSGHTVVYGGTDAGCMGALAEGVLGENGPLVGVVPKVDFLEGRHQSGLSERHLVRNLAMRIEKMVELAEAFIVFPGGLGTLDEAFSVLTLKAYGKMDKPILFYNFMAVWTPLLESLELLEVQGLIRRPIAELVRIVDKADEVCNHLKHEFADRGQSAPLVAEKRAPSPLRLPT